MDALNLPDAVMFKEIDKDQDLAFGNMHRFDPATQALVESVFMAKIVFVSPRPIRGIYCWDNGKQVFFFGYECQTCHDIVLVPECADKTGLQAVMKHDHPDLNRVAI